MGGDLAPTLCSSLIGAAIETIRPGILSGKTRARRRGMGVWVERSASGIAAEVFPLARRFACETATSFRRKLSRVQRASCKLEAK